MAARASTPGMWQALDGLIRYIATPLVAKHRPFTWLDSRICPSNTAIVIARDDDTAFGILHSRFPRGLVAPARQQPRRPPALHADHHLRDLPLPGGPVARHSRRRLHWRPARRRHRRRRSPPRRVARPLAQPARMVEWLEEPVPGYPPRPTPRNEEAARELRKRTLTNLYNARPNGSPTPTPHWTPPWLRPMAGTRTSGRRRCWGIAGVESCI